MNTTIFLVITSTPTFAENRCSHLGYSVGNFQEWVTFRETNYIKIKVCSKMEQYIS